MSTNLEQAINRFKQVVGNQHVIVDQAILNTYETATFETKHKIPAIVRPHNTAEIQACLKIANIFKTPIYPISTGLNVGYGSKVPTADNCIILELKRMNKILKYDEALAYVTIEPGVTQQQLYDYLQAQESNLWMDVTGSFAEHSLIGNIAERGFGHTEKSDHFANVGGMEVVLASGECIQTGFGRFGNAKAAGLYRWGVGPYIDGLFTQSNLGIITQITLWLTPAPDYFQNFYFSVEHEDALEEVIELLKPLRLDGTINSAIHIANDYKVLSSIRFYPWEKTGGKTPLSKKILTDFSKTWDFSAWNASGALYGSRQAVASARRKIKKRLKGKVKKIRFIDDRLLRIATFLKKPYAFMTGVNLTDMLKIIKPVFGMTKGVPTNAMIPSTYWRKKNGHQGGYEPNKDKCGLMWCAPVAPTNGRYAMEIWTMVNETLTHYGFEPSVSITLITERTMDCVVAIAYDREIQGEDARAQRCHDALLNKLIAAGYYPYRLGVQSMNTLPSQETEYCRFVRGIKENTDPNNILSPGRYSRLSPEQTEP